MGLAKVWVYAEALNGTVTGATLELLTKAREIGDTVEAVYVGSDADAVAGTLGEYGASKVYAIDPGDSLGEAIAGAAVAGLAQHHSPDLIVFAQSYGGRDAIARASARLGRTVITNGVGLDLDGDSVKVRVAIFGGNTLVETKFDGEKPYLAAIKAKTFEAASAGGGAAAVERVDEVDAGRAGEVKLVARHVEEREGPQLEDAAVVVSGGRGLGAAENYEPFVEKLAKLLNGASGASRAIVDAGWVPYSKQVGQTGKTVKPRVYLALGISGATQHMVGMKGSDNIIAINKDAEAPIFSIADLGIVGDV
ncbi:MAG: electron transfer flavoprotein subunit alpha/FixB family protein, partial [Acidimicrobiia bacterium]